MLFPPAKRQPVKVRHVLNTTVLLLWYTLLLLYSMHGTRMIIYLFMFMSLCDIYACIFQIHIEPLGYTHDHFCTYRSILQQDHMC